MRDVIFVSMEDWDDVLAPQPISVRGAFPAISVHLEDLFVGLPINVSNRIRRGLPGPKGPATSTVPGFPNITFSRTLKLFPDSNAAGRVANELAARFHIRRMARRLGLAAPLLWLTRTRRSTWRQDGRESRCL